MFNSINKIIFDADNTLFDFDLAEETALFRTLGHFNMPKPDGLIEYYRSINVKLWQQLDEKTITIGELKHQRAMKLFEFVGKNADVETFSLHYLDELARCQFLLTGVSETLQELANYCEMAIITNGLSRVQKPRLENSSIGHYFKALVISEELGVAKPDAEIYAHTCGLLGWENPSQVLMVGDNYRCDIQGAAGFGLQTCWFNIRNIKQHLNDHDFEIKQFDELLHHLKD